jgi:ribosomal protein S18 acetylase RimI-like enzyme
MDIRRATAQDAEQMAKLHVEAWRAAYQGLVPDAFLEGMDYQRRAARFREALFSQAEETYLAEVEGELLGMLTIGGCRDEDIDQAVTGEIWGIYLAQQHWRKGIGRILCDYGENLLSERGYRTATLWVLGGNARARRFYEAMGYTTDGANKVLDLGAPLEVVRYRKELSNMNSDVSN